MKTRHVCAVFGIAVSVGTVVFMRSLVASNDAQSLVVARRLLQELPVDAGAPVARLSLDYRPGGRVMQGPPIMATLAVKDGIDGVLVAKSLLAQRHLPPPAAGEELTLVGRRGAYKVKVAGVLDWDRPARGYPNMFVPQSVADGIAEEWTPFEAVSAEDMAPAFMSDAGRNFDRAKALLIWAAALTALALLVNSLFLSVEAKRRDIAILRMVGMTRGGVVKRVFLEASALAGAGWAAGAAFAVLALAVYTACDPALFPAGYAVSRGSLAATAAATPVVALAAALLALRPALEVRPLEASSAHHPRKRHFGMMLSFAFGFGAFAAVEVWGSSLMSSFVPSPEWPDAIVSVLPGGVSSFDIEKLSSIDGVRRIAELQPLQVNLSPLEEMPGFGGSAAGQGRGGKQYRNALLLASDWLPDFRFTSGSREEAGKALAEGDNCVITEMMARAHGWRMGDSVALDCGRDFKMQLKIAGIVDLNWHMVTSRGLVRGLNRMPVNTDGPVFVGFDTIAAADMRPQHYVPMTHLWLSYDEAFLASNGVFGAGRIVEREIVEALGGAYTCDDSGEVRGNTVRLHSRDEIADGTLAHGVDIIGSMARVPFIFIAVISLGFVAMVMASADSRSREFAVMRAVGATRLQLAGVLAREALKVASAGIVMGLAGGSLAGWLFTFATRKVMANWGLPASFAVPARTLAAGAALAVVFALAVAVPAALAVVSRMTRRRQARGSRSSSPAFQGVS